MSARPASHRLALALAGAVVLVVSGVLWVGLSGTIPFDSDEANHAIIGLRQYQDLAQGRWMDFVRHSYRTGQFPFLHGWTLVPFYGLFGPTLFAARAAGVVAFAVGALATGRLAWRLYDDVHAGALATVLFAVSPYMAAQAGVCMLEVPGAAATAIALALFVEGFRRPAGERWWWPALVAVAVLCAYFVKLNYGLWLAPAIAGTWVLRALGREHRGRALRDLAIYLGVLAVVAAVWYSTEAQREAFRGFLNNPSQATPVERDDPGFALPALSWGNFTSYFRLIAADYHVHWVVGAVVLLAASLGSVREWWRTRHPGFVACWLLVGWTWFVLSMGFREYSLARFIATALPALWALAAGPITALVRRVPAERVVAPAAVLGLAVVASFQIPDRQAAEYEIDDRFNPFFAFVADSIPDRSSVAVVNYTDRTTARHIGWLLATRAGASYDSTDVKGFLGERIFESDARLRDWLDDERPWGAADWQTYVVDVDLGPDYMDHHLVVPETVSMFRGTLTSLGDRLELAAQRDFPELGVAVRIWRDTEPPRHLGVDPRARTE